VGRTCGTHERRDKVYKILVGKPEVKRPLARPRVDGRMGSERVLGRLAEGVYSGLSWLKIGIRVYYVCVGQPVMGPLLVSQMIHEGLSYTVQSYKTVRYSVLT
jgi:hypothetical protein